MAGGGRQDAGFLPAPFDGVRLIALCLAVTLAFTVARFPFERLRPLLRGALAEATGAAVALDTLSLRPSLGVLALRAGTVLVEWPGGTSLQAESLSLRPAWSTSWLRGDAALHLSARNGALTPPQVPVAVPFSNLDAGFAFAGDAVELRRFALEGPMVAVTGAGSLSRSELAVDGQIAVRDPGMGAILAPLGIQVDEEGNAPVTLRGTPSRPQLR